SGAAGVSREGASRNSGFAAASLRWPLAGDQFDGTARARETPTLARLFRAAQIHRLHPRKESISRNSMKGTSSASLDLVKLCCRALDEKKAIDLRVLDVSEQSSITDYLVIATGNSEPHLRALRIELEKALDASHTRIVGMEIVQESGWI